MVAMLARAVVLASAWWVVLGGTGAAAPCAPGAGCAAASTATPPLHRLAAGVAWSLALDGGASATAYSVAPTLGEEASFGGFFASTTRTAWSLELVEAANLVLDRTT